MKMKHGMVWIALGSHGWKNRPHQPTDDEIPRVQLSFVPPSKYFVCQLVIIHNF